jgi:uncharacterized membrane protein YeaQ/YmgE (transglycosylase-associated protein family)
LIWLNEFIMASGNTKRLRSTYPDLETINFKKGVIDMPTWSLLVWLAIGAIAGLTARSFIGGTPPFGKIGDVILGIAGGVVGGFGLTLLGIGAGGTVGGLIVTCIAALAGALLLVWLSNRIKVKG